MTDKLEIQGKTVDEAVSEALLRMGARRDEVDVTVLEEPKNGLFGFLGGRPARVIVRRRAGGRTRSRTNDYRMDSKDHPPHDLGRGDGRGGRTRRGGRGRSGGRNEDETTREDRGARGSGRSGGREGREGRDNRDGRRDGGGRGRRDENRENREGREGRDTRESRDGRESRDNREGREKREGRDGRRDENRRGGRGDRPARGNDEVRAAAPTDNDRGEDQEKRSRRRRGRRGGRGRTGGTREGRPQPAAEAMDRLDLEHDQLGSIAAEQAQFHAQLQAEAAQENVETEGAEAGGEGRGESRSRSRRGGRSRGGRGRRRDDDRSADSRPAAQADVADDEPILPAEAAVAEAGEQVDAVEHPEHPEHPEHSEHPERQERAERPERRDRAERPERPERPAATQPDEVLATGIKASAYATAKRGLGEEAIDDGLTELASGMLVRAGFPCRCEVKAGEYRMVKIVTDDISAGMLIGRRGQTIDAVEHLVERMASTAAGDRVRMNLDINNYRRRREDTLLDQVDRAIAELRATGQDVHMEPMDARERRIVHLEAETHEGLCTWTVGGPGGKHVVIGIDDGTPRDLDEDPVDVTDEVAETVEAAAPEASDLADEAVGDEPAGVEGEEPERPGADA